ncbi:hypothetical protein [Streptomyces sp. ST2-7A]|uniref:hypothetical protein n=1 Tax=Streptomyces sp. ST2-7A TaxID=2907214 RepID=UPI001F2F0A42|nr:hypothetical protein [Streptomyces sp. ST2-7A]MCE7081004.1 hypothetical protein [Streptomyces sp. ST2-7A]
MTHRLIRIAGAAALTGTLLLPLTACGDDDGDTDDTIEGAQTTDPEDTSGGTGDEPAPPADDIERPEITLPGDVVNVFEPVDTDDPIETAVLGDHEHRVNSLDEVIVTGDLERPGLGFYSTGEALRSAVEWASPIIDEGWARSGEVRHYNRSVDVTDDETAFVTYCVDRSGSTATWRESGEVREVESSGADTRDSHYVTRLRVNGDGVWQTDEVLSEPDSEECS